MEQAVIDHLVGRQSATQWKGFLQATATEFASQLPLEDLRAMMHRIGVRMASAEPLGLCQTLEQMRDAMNRVWQRADWGWVEIEEDGKALVIRHFCSPLRAGFGAEHANWLPALLEGTYDQWFQSLGSGPALRVQQSSTMDDFGCVEYRLAQ